MSEKDVLDEEVHKDISLCCLFVPHRGKPLVAVSINEILLPVAILLLQISFHTTCDDHGVEVPLAVAATPPAMRDGGLHVSTN